MQHADILQIGARNMQNYSLPRRAGRAGHPVLLKRGMMSTIEELLLSAEYILDKGNSRGYSVSVVSAPLRGTPATRRTSPPSR